MLVATSKAERIVRRMMESTVGKADFYCARRFAKEPCGSNSTDTLQGPYIDAQASPINGIIGRHLV